MQARRTGRSRWSVAAPRDTPGRAPRDTPGRASGVVRPVSQSERVRKAEAVALHGGHPGGSASGKSPSTKGFPHGPVLRGRQSKDILFGMDHHRAADCKGGVRAVSVRCACKTATVRNPATGVPCLIRRSASFVKKGFLSRRPCAGCERGGGAGCAGLCGAVRPLSRQGISTACPLGTDLGMKVDLPRPPRGAAGGGRGRWAGPTFWNARRCVLHMHAWKKPPCQAARSPAAVGAGWTQWLGGQGQGCGAALGVRAKG